MWYGPKKTLVPILTCQWPLSGHLPSLILHFSICRISTLILFAKKIMWNPWVADTVRLRKYLLPSRFFSCSCLWDVKCLPSCLAPHPCSSLWVYLFTWLYSLPALGPLGSGTLLAQRSLQLPGIQTYNGHNPAHLVSCDYSSISLSYLISNSLRLGSAFYWSSNHSLRGLKYLLFKSREHYVLSTLPKNKREQGLPWWTGG